MRYPDLYQVEQRFQNLRIDDIPAAVGKEIAGLELERRCSPGQSVAITVGSRGIANLRKIVCHVVNELRRIGLNPFLIPAMGSHGGGTAQGQARVLRHYGITEEAVGAPVRSCMDVVQVGVTDDGVPVVMDRLAYEADRVVVINRVKPHTRYSGEFESGLAKMILIGLGKAVGAGIYHRAEATLTFDRLVRTVIPIVLATGKILFGLGIVENGYDETAAIRCVLPGQLLDVEKELLGEAKRLMPGLPFEELDLVIVNEMGKNYSGLGMDSNVVGCKSGVIIHRLYVRGLHEASNGNAAGIGQADIVHQRLVDKIDCEATRLNCVTSLNLEAGKLPISFPCDREAIETALTTIGLVAPEDARVCWIPNTLRLDELWVSAALLDKAKSSPNLSILNGPFPMRFDAAGDFISCPGMFAKCI